MATPTKGSPPSTPPPALPRTPRPMRRSIHSIQTPETTPDSNFRKIRRTKPGSSDRFIPNRSAMNMPSAQFNIRSPSSNRQSKVSAENKVYQERLAQAIGITLDSKILNFNAHDQDTSREEDIRERYNRPPRRRSSRQHRYIPLTPERILDAPRIADDYYLNVLAWSSTNIIAVGLASEVYLWNGSTCHVTKFTETEDGDSVASIAFSCNGDYIAIGTEKGHCDIWEVENDRILCNFTHGTRIGSMDWSSSDVLMLGCQDGNIFRISMNAPQDVTMLEGFHTDQVCGIKWSPDGLQWASGGNDNLVTIWDTDSTTPRYTKNVHTSSVKAVAWCPWQRNLLATGGGSYDRKIRFWDTSTGGLLKVVDTGSQVCCILWSKHYKELVSSHGFSDNQLIIWSYPSMTRVAELTGHKSRVLYLSMSPDGQTVVSAAGDENLKFWKCFTATQNGVLPMRMANDESESSRSLIR